MDPLQTLLQLLVTDASSVDHLSYILDNLSPTCLTPSPHLQKWITRVTSLMHSKNPAARWAAICTAHRMSFLSKTLLAENAQSWVGIIFPSLSKPEPVAILRASIRYLSMVLCVAGHNSEFQRQVAIPMVPKVSSALLAIAEKHDDQDIKTACIETLARLVPLYPSSHKALSQRLFGLCNQVISGSVHHATDCLLDATVNLYAVLHSLGGKVGGTTLWRNCLDDVLQLSWSAWLALRTTFPTSVQLSRKAIEHLRLPEGQPVMPADTGENPLTTAAHNLDRLKYGIRAMGALLRAPVSRPVKLPIGPLATFCWCLLASNLEDEEQYSFDPHVRAAESAAVGHIWILACWLLSCLAKTTQGLLAPHVPRLIVIVSSHLEHGPALPEKHALLQCVYHLLYFCPVVGAALGINRLLKATIMILSPLYLHQSRTETDSGTMIQSRTSKKRRRDYEAENVFSTTNVTVCASMEERDMLMAALDVVSQCMLNTELVPSTRSLANRILLSILLSLPSMAPSSLASDPNFHESVIRKVRDICIEGTQGTPHAMSKCTDLVLYSISSQSIPARDKLHSRVDLLLHPRRPPLVRTLPFVESLSLSSAEESVEETTTRSSLNLVFGNGDIRSTTAKSDDYPNPVNQGSLALDSQVSPPINQSRGRASPISIEMQPRTTEDTNDNLSMKVTTLSVLPIKSPSPVMSDVPSGSLANPEKGPTSRAYVVPMLVDESDHEELPTIDLGSDSDA